MYAVTELWLHVDLLGTGIEAAGPHSQRRSELETMCHQHTNSSALRLPKWLGPSSVQQSLPSLSPDWWPLPIQACSGLDGRRGGGGLTGHYDLH